jgi:hypothetical protein
MRWARDHWFSYMPKLRTVFQQGRLPCWDWGDVVRLVAPRALYQYTARDDPIFPKSASAYEAGRAARPIWRLYGHPDDCLVNVLHPGGHGVDAEARDAMYQWLEQQLGR